MPLGTVWGIEGEPFRYYVRGSKGDTLVDLEDNHGIGWCGCEDFQFRKAPLLENIRSLPNNADDFRCKHLLRARAYAAELLLDAMILLRKKQLQRLLKTGTVPTHDDEQ